MEQGRATIHDDVVPLELHEPGADAAAIYDRVIGPGGHALFPGGEPMRHQPADGEACLLLTMFHGAFDVEILDG